MTADEKRLQCQAITKRGNRCKLYALPNEKVCHVHIKKPKTDNENNNGYRLNVNNVLPEKGIKGNIYVFTHAHMMSLAPSKKSYLHLADPTDNKWIDYNKTNVFNPTDKILIKVGYTRKRPENRVKEWRDQCGHSEYILLYPGCLVPIYNNDKKMILKLSKLFKAMSISKKTEHIVKTHTAREYSHLNNEHTCFVSSEAYQTEQKIHRILRQRYGSGKMFCEGCAKHKINAANQEITKIIGVHTEWFLVPRGEMGTIWDIIESQCV